MPKPWELDWTGVKTEPAPPPKPTGQDLADLSAASAKAQAERDAARTYRSARQAVHDMGTGPWTAKWLDAITPDEDGGMLDTIGAVLGSPFRALVSDKTLAARDQLRTVNAQVALAGSQQMKGSSSDKDTALMRLAGIGPYKTVAENERILRQAAYESRLEDMRASAKANWIAAHGSLANAAQDGSTFQQRLQAMESGFRAPTSPPLRPAPPPVRKPASGWSITRIR
jgi:hypothetical protein